MKSHLNLQKYDYLKEIDLSYKHADRHYMEIFCFTSINTKSEIL